MSFSKKPNFLNGKSNLRDRAQTRERCLHGPRHEGWYVPRDKRDRQRMPDLSLPIIRRFVSDLTLLTHLAPSPWSHIDEPCCTSTSPAQMPSALAGIRQKSTNKMMPFKNNIGYSGVVVMGAAVGGIAANGVSDTFWDAWNRGVRQGKKLLR